MITKSMDRPLDKIVHLAVTINPKPNHKIYLSPIQQYLKYDYQLSKILSSYSQYYMRPELTLQGHIHYHLHLQLTSLKEKYKWQKSTIKSLKQLGNTKIKICNKPEGWISYIDKDKTLYNEIFNSPSQIGSLIEYTPKTIREKLKRTPSPLDCTQQLDSGIKPLIAKHSLKLKTYTSK